MTIRVLFLDHAGELGGAELSLLDLVTKLPITAHVVLLSEGPFKERLKNAGASVEVVTAGSSIHNIRRRSGVRALLRSMPAVLSLVRQVSNRAGDYDLIYANSQKALVIAALAGILSRRPVVWHLRDILTSEHFSGVTRKAVVTLANYCARKVITNSAATARAFVDAGGSKNKTTIIYNSIDPKVFDEIDAISVRKIRDSIVPAEVFLVGVFGRLAPWKGQHVLIESLTDLPDIHVAVVGSSLFGEEKYERELKDQVAKLGLQDRVHFLGFQSEIPSFMRAMDIIVHTSISPEPFGRVIVEGMLAERPVIAAKAGGVLEILDDGKSGLLVSPGDPKKLAKAIKVLGENAVLAKRIAVEGKKVALARFSPPKMLNRVHNVLVAVSSGISIDDVSSNDDQ